MVVGLFWWTSVWGGWVWGCSVWVGVVGVWGGVGREWLFGGGGGGKADLNNYCRKEKEKSTTEVHEQKKKPDGEKSARKNGDRANRVAQEEH